MKDPDLGAVKGRACIDPSEAPELARCNTSGAGAWTEGSTRPG